MEGNVMPEILTDRQANILGFMADYQELNGHPPTVQEICDKFDIETKNGAMSHINSLHRKGKIVPIGRRGSSRFWRVVKQTGESKCPHCGNLT